MQSSLKHVDPQHLSRLTSLMGISARTNTSEPPFADFEYVVQKGERPRSAICALCYVNTTYYVLRSRPDAMVPLRHTTWSYEYVVILGMSRKRCQEFS
jgi:hypothetical protein